MPQPKIVHDAQGASAWVVVGVRGSVCGGWMTSSNGFKIWSCSLYNAETIKCVWEYVTESSSLRTFCRPNFPSIWHRERKPYERILLWPPSSQKGAVIRSLLIWNAHWRCTKAQKPCKLNYYSGETTTTVDSYKMFWDKHVNKTSHFLWIMTQGSFRVLRETGAITYACSQRHCEPFILLTRSVKR